ncbi:MAG: hypothetical protein IKT99_00035, partial [Oscillospiraceae bacterium]|nr:hypothetical protein [Oscillospiraceae bacterium]
MKKTNHSILPLLTLLLALSLLLGCGGCTLNAGKDVKAEAPADDGPAGYTAAATLQDGFIACGSGGRVDKISLEGEVTTLESGTTSRLNSVFTEDGNVLISGNNGTLLVSNDAGESFRKVNCG